MGVYDDAPMSETWKNLRNSFFAGLLVVVPVAASLLILIGVFTWGAYHIATFVRGVENLMMDFAIRREYADCLIRTIAERTLAVYRTLA